MEYFNQDLVPKFDHRFGSLQPSAWLDYFEAVANEKCWSEAEKSIKLIAKMDGTLQESLIRTFNVRREYSDVRAKFLETKTSSKDFMAILTQQFDPKTQNLKVFLKYKREAARVLATRSEDQLYVESVRRSLPSDYKWINSVNDVNNVLVEQMKQNKEFPRKDEAASDRKKQREVFRNSRFELMQKAYNLSKESDCKVALMIFDNEGIVSQYSSDSMETILTKYLKKEYSSKRLFTNQNIEMAMGDQKLKSSNEATTSSNHADLVYKNIGPPSKEATRRDQASSVDVAKIIAQREKQQQADALNRLNKELSNLKINDQRSVDNARLNSLNSIVYHIACMTDEPVEFYNRYLTYYGLLTQHVYQQEQLLLANANHNNQNNGPVDNIRSTHLEKPVNSTDPKEPEIPAAESKEEAKSEQVEAEEDAADETEDTSEDSSEDSSEYSEFAYDLDSFEDDFYFVNKKE